TAPAPAPTKQTPFIGDLSVRAAAAAHRERLAVVILYCDGRLNMDTRAHRSKCPRGRDSAQLKIDTSNLSWWVFP
ncbi:hypothetical protein V494_06549, partial [Pseudogymnoascus sp. VKM F-4513 (FW-928)]